MTDFSAPERVARVYTASLEAIDISQRLAVTFKTGPQYEANPFAREAEELIARTAKENLGAIIAGDLSVDTVSLQRQDWLRYDTRRRVGLVAEVLAHEQKSAEIADLLAGAVVHARAHMAGGIVGHGDGEDVPNRMRPLEVTGRFQEARAGLGTLVVREENRGGYCWQVRLFDPQDPEQRLTEIAIVE